MMQLYPIDFDMVLRTIRLASKWCKYNAVQPVLKLIITYGSLLEVYTKTFTGVGSLNLLSCLMAIFGRPLLPMASFSA